MTLAELAPFYRAIARELDASAEGLDGAAAAIQSMSDFAFRDWAGDGDIAVAISVVLVSLSKFAAQMSSLRDAVAERKAKADITFN